MNSQTKTSPEKFGEEYFRTGNYHDYMTRKFEALAKEVMEGVPAGSSVLDFGCGYGGVTSEILRLGYNVRGVDISNWAISECHRRFPQLQDRVSQYTITAFFKPSDYVIALDVFEHISNEEINSILELIKLGKGKKMAVRIPVSLSEGAPFALKVSNNDPTHITCHTKEWWIKKFETFGFKKNEYFQGSAIYDSPGVLAARFWK